MDRLSSPFPSMEPCLEEPSLWIGIGKDRLDGPETAPRRHATSREMQGHQPVGGFAA